MKNQFFNGNTYTLQEIANRLGITKERVRQIEVQAIKKLRHPMMRKRWEEVVESVNEVKSVVIV